MAEGTAATALLAFAASSGQERAAHELITRLGRDEPALDLLVGHLYATRRATLAGCRAQLDGSLRGGTARPDEAVLRLSLRELRDDRQLAEDLMGLLACFGGRAVPRELLGEPLRSATLRDLSAAAPARVEAVLDRLRARRLLRIEDEAVTLAPPVLRSVERTPGLWHSSVRVLDAVTADPYTAALLLPPAVAVLHGVPLDNPGEFVRATALALRFAAADIRNGDVRAVLTVVDRRRPAFRSVDELVAALLAEYRPTDPLVVAPLPSARFTAALAPPPRAGRRPASDGAIALSGMAAPAAPVTPVDALLAQAGAECAAGLLDEAEATLGRIDAAEGSHDRRARRIAVDVHTARGDLLSARAAAAVLLLGRVDARTRWELRFAVADIDRELSERPGDVADLRALLAESDALVGADEPAVLSARRRYALAVADGGHTLAAHAELRAVAAAATREELDALALTAAVDAAELAPGAARDADAAVAELAGLAAGAERDLGSEHELTLHARAGHARRLVAVGRPAAAVEPLRKVVLARARRTSRPDARVSAARIDLGRAVLESAGRGTDAGELADVTEMLGFARHDLVRLRGAEHAHTLRAHSTHLAAQLALAGRRDHPPGDAHRQLRIVLEKQRRLRGDQHPEVAATRRYLRRWGGT